MNELKVSAHFQLYQYENVKKRIIGGFEFLMDDNANEMDKETTLELIKQFKGMFFEPLEIDNKQPHLYNQKHFYAVFRNHELSLNFEFILRIRKYEHREGYECHLSHKVIKNVERILNLDSHNFYFPINL